MDNSHLLFRPARGEDTGRILQIIREAQAQMRALGSAQWQDGYPAAEDIDRDLAKGYGRVLCASGGEVVAYGAVVFDGEEAYASIEGAWLGEGEYVVLHRLAVADGWKGRGVAREYLLRTEALARESGLSSFRIDTNYDNRYMLRLLERTGFIFCGKIRYKGGERLAFEKRL